VNGVVTLTGQVDNAEQKSRAIQVAQGCERRFHVKDNLTTKTTG
jgi:osmotically-inducible protein OsmY